MVPARKPVVVGLGLLLAVLSSAPVLQDKPASRPKVSAMAEKRHELAKKQFDLTWQYYRQNRVGTFEVYLWSRLLLDARREAASQASDRVAACQEHLDHMKDLDALVRNIRRLGFGRSSDVGACDYWLVEAEYWLVQAQSG